jgi:hypothetical protein
VKKRAFVGLQLMAYDVLDEGPEAVLEGAQLLGADALLLGVSLHEGQIRFEPGRAGDLLHNPKRKHHLRAIDWRPGDAGYPPELTPSDEVSDGTDGALALEQLANAAAGSSLEVVPWATLLTQPVAYAAPASCVVDARGKPAVPGWLCPSRPETVAYVRALIRDFAHRSGCRSIFIDRMRFPEWGPAGPIGFFSCFCDSCLARAKSEGFDIEAARRALLELVDALEHDPEGAAERAAATFASGAATLRSTVAHGEIADWLRFRHRIVEDLVREARDEASSHEVELWLDIWPPSYGWLFGQDLGRLAEYGSWVKPFTYHRWGGGADIAGLIAEVSDEDSVQESLYRAYAAFFRFPGPDRFAEFRKVGLAPGFITSETALAGEMLDGRGHLAAGLQLWGSGKEELHTALEHAWAASPEGVFFHCYGWASFDEMRIAGEWITQHPISARDSSPVE